jgi:hypothetical protein
MPSYIRQCIYHAAEEDFGVLAHLTNCRNNDDTAECFAQNPELKRCMD